MEAAHAGFADGPPSGRDVDGAGPVVADQDGHQAWHSSGARDLGDPLGGAGPAVPGVFLAGYVVRDVVQAKTMV
ncbi:hypothetical protein [Streptomyces sp. NPDC002588]|uniref:hypothetical protein n=1 Tax=Streptomyces sp. NPDC002588 TaxID=3154419 RepID=UPI00331A9124